jgi:hypothetical protein
MESESDWNRRRRILSWLNSKFRENSDNFHFDATMAKELESERSLIDSECKLMFQEELIDKDEVTNGGTMYRINAKGVQEYKTKYDKEWLNQQNRKKFVEKNEILEKEKKEDQKHREMVLEAKKANKNTTIGMWIALAIGTAGLIIAIFKP